MSWGRARVGITLLVGVAGIVGAFAWSARGPRDVSAPPPAGGQPAAEPKKDAGSVRMDAQVVALDGRTVDVVGPEGHGRFSLRPGAADTAAVGDTVNLSLSFGPDGVPVVEGVIPHTGLPIAYGHVAAVSPTSLQIEGPFGAAEFQTNRWSDLPEALAVGDWVSVKHYAADGARAVLNVRRYPGRVEETGTVTAVGSGSFEMLTLGGVRRYPVVPAGVVVGATLTVHYRRAASGEPADFGVEAAPEPHRFIGKMSAFDAPSRTFSMVDAWGSTLGLVRFHLPGDVPADLVPGDLAEATWRISDGRPTLDALVERPLSKVFFGRIDQLDATSLSLTTLQRQPKRLRRTAETWMPTPIAVGDMADVMWSPDPAGGPPLAEAVVKE